MTVADYLWRLAVVLPLILLLLVGVLVILHRRQGGTLATLLPARRTTAETALVTTQHSLSPTARLAVVRFHGREHLIGITGQSLLLIASADATLPPPEAHP